jgi:hypothetical protein
MNKHDERREGEACKAKACDGKPSGPVREAGGTTGAGNLSEGGADRTGGATGGVPTEPNPRLEKFRPPPSA